MSRTFNSDCERFGKIVERLAHMYSPDEVCIWLLRRNPQLEGRRAVDVIMTDEADRVVGCCPN